MRIRGEDVLEDSQAALHGMKSRDKGGPPEICPIATLKMRNSGN